MLVPGDAIGFDVPIPNAGPGSFQSQPKAFLTFGKSDRLLLNTSEHLIERIGEKTQLIAAGSGSADGVIPPLGDDLCRIGQAEDWIRDAPLEGIGDCKRYQNRSDQDWNGDSGIETQ